MLIALIFFLLSLHYLTNSRPFYTRFCNFAHKYNMVTGHNTLTITTKLYRHIMKRPTWLDKERLYHIIFLADTPAGKTYDVLLIIGILASIITAFVESMPSLAHPFQVALEVLEYFFAVIFTFDSPARRYWAPSRRE